MTDRTHYHGDGCADIHGVFDADEIELLRDGVAGELARFLRSEPVDLNRYEALIALGNKLGMEL